MGLTPGGSLALLQLLMFASRYAELPSNHPRPTHVRFEPLSRRQKGDGLIDAEGAAFTTRPRWISGPRWGDMNEYGYVEYLHPLFFGADPRVAFSLGFPITYSFTCGLGTCRRVSSQLLMCPLGLAAYDPEMAASTETLTFSNLYPDRPIRPMPKRRLRERLSPEVAESIRYPPSTRPTSIFYPPYPTDIPEEDYRGHGSASAGGIDDESGDEVRQFVRSGRGRQNGAHLDAMEGNRGSRGAVAPRQPPEMMNAYPGPRQPPKSDHGGHTSAMLPPSDLSADGYESFENTNNKKKRKIPTAGDASLGGSHAMSDGGTIPVSAGLSAAHMQDDGVGSPQYAALNGSSNNKGISGAGRGMFGRARNGRSPLRTLSNANNWTDRNSKLRPGRQWGPSGKLDSLFLPRVHCPSLALYLPILDHPDGPEPSKCVFILNQRSYIVNHCPYTPHLPYSIGFAPMRSFDPPFTCSWLDILQSS